MHAPSLWLRFVGLSSIYNLEKQMERLHLRGLNRSVLYKIIGGKHNDFFIYFINAYFGARRRGESGEVLLCFWG